MELFTEMAFPICLHLIHQYISWHEHTNLLQIIQLYLFRASIPNPLGERMFSFTAQTV